MTLPGYVAGRFDHHYTAPPPLAQRIFSQAWPFAAAFRPGGWWFGGFSAHAEAAWRRPKPDPARTGLDLMELLCRAGRRRGHGRAPSLQAPPEFARLREAPGLLIIVDYVATTGRTLAAARRALRAPSLAVAYVAWRAADAAEAARQQARVRCPACGHVFPQEDKP